MNNIRSLLKKSKTVLFTDCNYFNKEITGVRNLSDIKDIFQIKGNLKKVAYFGNKIIYKLNNSYDFTLTLMD